MKSYRVAEIFRSLQGEGPSIGMPATFLRLQGCAVGCSWCDTKFSWPESGGEAMSLDAIDAATNGRRDLLVVTGGEPLAHPAIDVLLQWALARWARVEVETSGIVAPELFSDGLFYNWSPKLSRVTPRHAETWVHSVALLARNGVCKIVVGTRFDWDEALGRLEYEEVPASRVVIMPQGVEAQDLDDRMRWLAPLCIERGFRLSPRLHVQLWGRERGQ